MAPSTKVYVSGRIDVDAETIVFVHGLGGNATNFDPIIQHAGLQKHFQLIPFDLEGHGLSPISSEAPTIQSYVEALTGVMDGAGVRRATIVGHSMGCLIAMTFAAQHPARVTKLVLLGPVRQFPSTPFQPLLDRAAAARQSMSKLAATLVQAGTGEQSHANPLVMLAVKSSILSTSPEGYARACEALAYAADPAFGSITAQTYVVRGTEDKTCSPAVVDVVKEGIRGSQVYEVPGVGHWALLEDYKAVGELVALFVGPRLRVYVSAGKEAGRPRKTEDSIR